MSHTEGQLTTQDELNLYARAWLPDGPIRAVIAFSHGLGEHIGRYEHVGAALAAEGYALQMADLRGHGRSPGKRGHVMAWQDYHRDFEAIIAGARALAPAAPLFIGGHSNGGLILLSYAVSHTPEGCAGVIASAPLLRVGFEPPKLTLMLARVLSLLAPGMQLNNELDAKGLSHDQAVVDAYINDPLVHPQISTRYATELMKAQAETLARARNLRLPLLIIHGDSDPIVAVSGSRDFYAAAASADKTLKEYEGLHHELFNEFEKERVLADLIAWLDAHTP